MADCERGTRPWGSSFSAIDAWFERRGGDIVDDEAVSILMEHLKGSIQQQGQGFKMVEDFASSINQVYDGRKWRSSKEHAALWPYVIMSDKVAESESESTVAIAMCPNACGEGGKKVKK